MRMSIADIQAMERTDPSVTSTRSIVPVLRIQVVRGNYRLLVREIESRPMSRFKELRVREEYRSMHARWWEMITEKDCAGLHEEYT
jgi:hypothetical protein